MDSAYQVLIIFAVVVVVLIKEWIPIGVVGIAIPFILVLLNISTTADAMSYFISEVVVLIPCVYIMGDSLYRVGVADKIGNMILHLASRLSRKHPKWSEVVVMSIIILGSGAASLLLPRYGVTGAFMAVGRCSGQVDQNQPYEAAAGTGDGCKYMGQQYSGIHASQHAGQRCTGGSRL